MTEGTTPRLYNVKDACAVLGGISRTTFYALVNAGKLKTVKIGQRTFVTGEAMQEFIDSLESPSPKLSDRELRALRRRRLKLG